MDTAHDDIPEGRDENPQPDDSLPPYIAYQTDQESRENAPQAPGTAGERYRRGKVEAETYRVSEEVTRAAQRKRREAEAAAQAEVEKAEAAAAPGVAPQVPQEAILPAPSPMREFFVPLDGSLEGERALPYATALARLLHAHLLLGHVTPTEPAPALGQMFGSEASKRQKALQAFAPEALPYLQQQRERLAADGLKVDTAYLSAPTVAAGLLQLETLHDIDLAFVSLGTYGAPGSMKVGRVADSLIRLGKAPVLVIPPEADAGAHSPVLRHIVVTLDGSPLAEQTLGPLMGLLQQLRDQQGDAPMVTLLAVAEDFSIQPDYQAYLDTLRETLAALQIFSQVQLRAQAIVGSAPGAIVGAIEYDVAVMALDESESILPVDMLMMTTHGRGGMSRWLFGSVADYVLPRVSVPVLVTRPGSPVRL